MAAPHAVPIRLTTEDLIHFDEALKRIPPPNAMSCASRSSCSPIRAIPTGRSPPSCSVMSPPSPSGADGLPSPDALVCSTNHAPADRHATHPCNKHKSSPCFANPKRPPPRQTPPAPLLFQPRTWSRPPWPLKRPPLLQARKWLRPLWTARRSNPHRRRKWPRFR